ncbi:hypothetical protein EDEG_02228 [Edhazardia aedis USNM 41457]|uniref:Uncharacterized protein n=1 Tax=Edhazardia aedis (strain USNM 41457) TaxID=1003232 RepID=J8ZUV5_EDHAE|nr:hypothetical protein EDEG_02228 [Edhazardia aedis USNM 41457]|eukprot:EJW03463.1 hypothetical protein EDEG_02228 [Edhazardia aedis USNM 41457]
MQKGIYKPSAARLRRNEYVFSTSGKTFHPCFLFVRVGMWTPTVRKIFQHATGDYYGGGSSDGLLLTSTLNTYPPFIVFPNPFVILLLEPKFWTLLGISPAALIGFLRPSTMVAVPFYLF